MALEEGNVWLHFLWQTLHYNSHPDEDFAVKFLDRDKQLTIVSFYEA